MAFTGMSGIGKTVLFDHLTGEAYKDGWTLPHPSLDEEKGTVDRHTKSTQRMAMSVVPGEPGPRVATMNDIFLGDKPVDGVVHVVAYGFRELRNRAARERLIEDDQLETLDVYRDYQLGQEIADLQATCDVIRQSFQKHKKTGKPDWMLIAATKADLYADQLEDVETYYSPEGKGAFVSTVHEFVKKVGSDNFRWNALPVCAYPITFEWNQEQVHPQLDLSQREAMLSNFVQVLEHYCG